MDFNTQMIMKAHMLSKQGVLLFAARILRNIDLSDTAPDPIPSCFHLLKKMDITFTFKHQ